VAMPMLGALRVGIVPLQIGKQKQIQKLAHI
jgi:hypothetical protein